MTFRRPLRLSHRHRDREQDEARFTDLCRRHGLEFRQTGSRYHFSAVGFTARGLHAALAYAEGFAHGVFESAQPF